MIKGDRLMFFKGPYGCKTVVVQWRTMQEWRTLTVVFCITSVYFKKNVLSSSYEAGMLACGTAAFFL